jgi:site-specific recombinase XerD
MKAQQTFSILFWISKNRLKNGKAPIYARITINGKRVEISTQREISPLEWDARSQIVTGRAKEAKQLNSDLAVIKTKLLSCHSKLIARGANVTAESLKNEYTGVIEKPRMLLQIVRQHNDDIKKLIGKDYAIATWVKYNTTQKHLTDFLKWKYNLSDINILDLGFEFITDFEFFLKAERDIDTNTNAKYIKNLKKIIHECVAKDWLPKDPFMAYKVKMKKTEREFLTELELQAIHEKEFTIGRLGQIKDIFLFSCYTGLAYIDVFNLTAYNVALGIDGEKWVFTHRQKTETPSRIPLLPQALAILEKYKNHPVTMNSQKLLPVPTNQKTNAYLKEIADCCGIFKKLTFHIARHTFATTVTLTNGVPMESVSKMLGHKKLQTTQHYAKILDEKVSTDMQNLKRKFTNSSDKMQLTYASQK